MVRDRSMLAGVSRTAGSNNSAGIPGNYKVTGYGQRTSAALEAEPTDLLLGPSGSIKGGSFARSMEIIKRHLSNFIPTRFQTS